MFRRRQLLKAACAGVGISALGAVGAFRIAADDESPLRQLRFKSVEAAQSAALLGAAYLTRFPAERDRERLMDLVFPEATSEGSLQERIRLDFTVGRTVKLDGWVLSVTELRYCALTALQFGLA